EARSPTHFPRFEPLPFGGAAPDLSVVHVAAPQLRLARELVALAGRAAPEAFDERMAYEPTPADRADAVRLWRANDLDEASDVVVMHSAPGGPAKRWPAERFAIVADHISGRLGGQVLLTGGRGDVEEVRKIAARCTRSPVELAGQTSFGALAALFERSRIAIGSDNGAMHLATARGVPTLRLFGPTDARVWEGWNGNVSERPLTVSITSPRVCSPCHRLDIPEWRTVPGARGDAYPCMDEITVETVIDAVERLWRETNAR
ncbi:MAG: glycosyltransferase family 9 protein, partial [Chloroflexota bacterium]